MEHLKKSITERMAEDLLTLHYNKINITKKIIMNASSLDILCATEVEEFYYSDNDEPVAEGDPIGVDVETPQGVELVLFSNIYWSPSFHEDE
tara:strand:+ start:515 stop:790 length:276 start_codon:yes stop_codon:yes gene_type:complete